MYILVELMCCHYRFITGSGGYQDGATTKVRLISDPVQILQGIINYCHVIFAVSVGLVWSGACPYSNESVCSFSGSNSWFLESCFDVHNYNCKAVWLCSWAAVFNNNSDWMRFMWCLEYLDYSGRHKIWTLSSLFYTMFYTGVLHK